MGAESRSVEWRDRVQKLFHAALEHEPSEREAFLDGACAEDVALREQVSRLLAAIEQDDLEDIEEGMLGRLEVSPGEQVDRYTIIEHRGEGGYGSVFEAEQSEPVRRRVALKLIKLGMDTRSVVARFEAERQALAIMEHPGIAKIFDAGATSTGRPYFVMELVEGIPITNYCVQEALDLPARLKLFEQVCEAVHHAHQKGVIHRDLKPSNILVGGPRERPQPKIIDFGIAKATGVQHTQTTMLTQARQFVGTPDYVSPEQATLSGGAVDTRSDVYSLGVVLYELVTGTTPFASELKSANLEEMMRVIREVRPAKPSTRATAERLRAHDARSLAVGKIQSDLDWIILHALEKEPERRYDSAIDLARDVRCFLSKQPITARPPSKLYEMRLFARRHKAGAGATLVAVVALLVGAGMGTYGLIRAKREAEEATLQAHRAQEIGSLLKQMFTTADPRGGKPKDYTVRQLLDEFATELTNGLNLEPVIEVDLLLTVARAYSGLGEYSAAAPHLARAVAIAENTFGEGSAELAKVRSAWGWLQHQLGQQDEALTELRSALRVQLAEHGSRHLDSIETRIYLAEVLITLKDFEGAVTHARAAQEDALALLKEGHRLTVQATVALAMATNGRGDREKALLLGNDAVQAAELNYGKGHPVTVFAELRLAELQRDTNTLTSLIPMLKKILGEEHPETMDALVTLGTSLAQGGDVPALEALVEKTFHITMAEYMETGSQNLNKLSDLARVLLARAEDIEQVALRAYEEAAAHLGADHDTTIAVRRLIGHLYRVQGKLAEAESMQRIVLAEHAKKYGSGHFLTAACLNSLEDILILQSRYEEAAQLYHEPPVGTFTEAEHASLMYHAGSLRLGEGRFLEGRGLLERSLALRRSLGKAEDTLESLRKLRSVHRKLQWKSVVPLAEEAGALSERGANPRDLRALEDRYLAGAYLDSVARFVEGRDRMSALEPELRAALGGTHDLSLRIRKRIAMHDKWIEDRPQDKEETEATEEPRLEAALNAAFAAKELPSGEVLKTVQEYYGFLYSHGRNLEALELLDRYEDRQRNAVWEKSESRVLLLRDAFWKYETDPTLPPSWVDLEFDDSRWRVGRGWFGVHPSFPGTVVELEGNSQVPQQSFYRRVFEIPDGLEIRALKVRLMRDDGAVIYLNGREVVRDPVDAGTPGFTGVFGFMEIYPRVFLLPSEAINPGRNVIAAKVYQNLPTTSDLVFGLQLEALVVRQD